MRVVFGGDGEEFEFGFAGEIETIDELDGGEGGFAICGEEFVAEELNESGFVVVEGVTEGERKAGELEFGAGGGCGYVWLGECGEGGKEGVEIVGCEVILRESADGGVG